MTVSELIERLKAFPPEMVVLKRYDDDGSEPYWGTFDGHYFQTCTVYPAPDVANTGLYRDQDTGTRSIEILEL